MEFVLLTRCGEGRGEGRGPHEVSPYLCLLLCGSYITLLLAWTLLLTKALYSFLLCLSNIYSLGSSYTPDIVQGPGGTKSAAVHHIALMT